MDIMGHVAAAPDPLAYASRGKQVFMYKNRGGGEVGGPKIVLLDRPEVVLKIVLFFFNGFTNRMGLF